MTLAQHGEAIWGIQEHFLEVPIQEELRDLRDKVDVAEAESASLRVMIRTMGAVETVLRVLPSRPRGLQETQGVHDQLVRISLIDILLHDLCIN
ncbi:hypothetical protein Tco_0996875 [Tanacetum coccineum]